MLERKRKQAQTHKGEKKGKKLEVKEKMSNDEEIKHQLTKKDIEKSRKTE